MNGSAGSMLRLKLSNHEGRDIAGGRSFRNLPRTETMRKMMKATAIAVFIATAIILALYGIGVVATGLARPWEWSHTWIFSCGAFIALVLGYLAGVGVVNETNEGQ